MNKLLPYSLIYTVRITEESGCARANHCAQAARNILGAVRVSSLSFFKDIEAPGSVAHYGLKNLYALVGWIFKWDINLKSWLIFRAVEKIGLSEKRRAYCILREIIHRIEWFWELKNDFPNEWRADEKLFNKKIHIYFEKYFVVIATPLSRSYTRRSCVQSTATGVTVNHANIAPRSTFIPSPGFSTGRGNGNRKRARRSVCPAKLRLSLCSTEAISKRPSRTRIVVWLCQHTLMGLANKDVGVQGVSRTGGFGRKGYKNPEGE